MSQRGYRWDEADGAMIINYRGKDIRIEDAESPLRPVRPSRIHDGPLSAGTEWPGRRVLRLAIHPRGLLGYCMSMKAAKLS